jgi:hypothetical protein
MKSHVINWRNHDHPSTTDLERSLAESIVQDWHPGHWTPAALQHAAFSRQWMRPDELAHLVRLPWVQLQEDGFPLLPERAYEISFMAIAESADNAALVSGPLPTGNSVRIHDGAAGDHAQFWTKVSGSSTGWYWDTQAYVWSMPSFTDARLAARPVRFRSHADATPLEREMATWIVDAWDPGYYERHDIERARFSRQYLDKDGKVLGFLILMPQKYVDYPSMKVLKAPYDAAGQLNVEGDVFVSRQKFSPIAPNLADIDAVRDGRTVRHQWDGNAYVPV